jgi:putative lipoprotein
MRVSLILIILISLFFVNRVSGQDNIVQSSKFKVDFLQSLKPQFQIPKFKITISDPWFGRDKVHHFLTSALLSGVGYYFLREEQSCSNKFSQQGGFGFSISLGLAKEVRDGFKPQNAFSVKDLVADILGTLVGIAIVSDL